MTLESCISAFTNPLYTKPLSSLFLAEGMKIIPADEIGRALHPKRVAGWRERDRVRPQQHPAAAPPADVSGRPRRQAGMHQYGIKECQQLGMRTSILSSGSHAWKSGHVCIKGPSSGVTIFEKAAAAIMGDFGRRNADWWSHVERSTTQAFFLAKHEGKKQAVTFAAYTDTNDCAVVVHLFVTREDCRKRGHGKSMLSLLEQHAHSQGKALFIEYNPSVQESKLFWTKRGYSESALGCYAGLESKPNTALKDGLRRWYPRTPIWCQRSGEDEDLILDYF